MAEGAGLLNAEIAGIAGSGRGGGAGRAPAPRAGTARLAPVSSDWLYAFAIPAIPALKKTGERRAGIRAIRS